MGALLAVLAPIALVDSGSIVPLSIVPLVIIFSTKQPLPAALAFLAGIFLSYLVGGLAIVFGLDGVFAVVNDIAKEKLYNPQAPDMVLQIIIGVVLVFIAIRMGKKGVQKERKAPPKDVTPWAAFSFAVVLNVVGLPGALLQERCHLTPHLGVVRALPVEIGGDLGAGKLAGCREDLAHPLPSLVGHRRTPP